MASSFSDDVAGGESFSLVSSWLSSADLGYAVPNFEMAGIVTPRSFVDLRLDHYESLGITRPDDRKRLFYLVHEVKKAVEREGGKGRGTSGSGGGDRAAKNDDDDNGAPPPGSRTGETRSNAVNHSDHHGHLREDGVERSGGARSRVVPALAFDVGGGGGGGSQYGHGGGGHGHGHGYDDDRHHRHQHKLISTVDITPPSSREPISPVTLSSPIAHSSSSAAAAAEDYFNASGTSDNFEFGGRGGGAATGTKERLERELELRALRRRREREQEKRRQREEKIMTMARKEEEEEEDRRGESKMDRILARDGGGAATRRKSFLPSVASNSSRRSSVSSYRGGAATSRRRESDDNAQMDWLDPRLPSPLGYEEEHNKHGKSDERSDDDDDDIIAATPKTASSSAVDARSRQSGIGIHHRSTVKKANKGRRLSGIPRAAVPPLRESDDDDDDGSKEEDDNFSLASETSDLSASVSSYRSLGSGTSAYSNVENSNNGSNGGADRRRNNGRLMAAKLGKGGGIGTGVGMGGGGSSIASSSHVGKKRLSTIPSSSVAPLSPLTGLSSAQLDESIAGARAEGEGRAASLAAGTAGASRRTSSLGGAGVGVDTGGKKGGPSSSGSVGRPGSAGSLGSRNSRLGSATSRPSSRGSLASRGQRRKSNVVSATSSDASAASAPSTAGRRRRLKSPAPRERSRSPTPSHSSRGGAARAQSTPRSPYSPKGGSRAARARSTPRSPYSPGGGGSSPPPTPTHRANRSVSPKRTLGVVGVGAGGGRPLSPVRSPVRGRPLSPVRSPTRGGARSPKASSPKASPRRVKSPVGGGGNAPVFVHGMPEDDSWATQIAQLRGSFESEHEEHMEELRREFPDEEEDVYDMRIRVIVRKRPMSGRESERSGEVDVIQPLDYGEYGRILVHQPKTKLDLAKEVETSSFAFDNVFGEGSNNVEIYDRAVRALIPGVFRGKWASVFAYGQTGSGKTFTMMGSNATGMRAGNQVENNSGGQNPGLYYLAAEDVFRISSDPAYADVSIGVSLFEIYGGKLLDLLNARNPVRCLEDRKGRVNFPGLSEHPVSDAEELMEIIDAGALNRSTGTTSANADSSRSHAVLQLSLRKNVGRAKNKEHGRLTFIDLAGSERGADTSKANKTTRMEGAEINTSLLALKEVIRALATGSSLKRIPFRGSKLTQVLKESFVGKNSRTVMVSCVAPNITNCDHTLNTLRYADRVKERDPQTGKLSASVAANSKIKRDRADDVLVRVKLPPRPLTAPAASFRIERDDESSDDDDVPPPPSEDNLLLQSLEEGTFEEEIDAYNEDAAVEKSIYSDDFDYDRIVESDENDSLEEVLKSSGSLPAAPKQHPKSPPRPLTVKDNPAAQTLIATHKSIMSKLLLMLQHEMTLVNDTDADRSNIDEYLKELESLSSQQLSLLSTLRESLVSYSASKNLHDRSAANTSQPSNRMSIDSTVDYDSSFDLRD